MSVFITALARKHGAADTGIMNAISDSILVVGPDLAGDLLELIGIESDEGDELIFHAMRLRPVFNYLLPPNLRA